MTYIQKSVQEFNELDWRIWNSKTSTFILIPENNRKFYENFLTQKLQGLALEIIEEAEGKKKVDNSEEDQSVADSVYYEQQRNIGYNKACEDIINTIKGKTGI